MSMMLAWSVTMGTDPAGVRDGMRRLPHPPGTKTQDRAVGFDSLYVNAMLRLLTFGIRTGSTLYFEAALIIALLDS